MQLWELAAREAIRDLVARYNASADSGRFEQALGLFADDAIMVTSFGEYRGHDEILSIFTGARAHVVGDADATAAPNKEQAAAPVLLRHHTSTHQIDLIDETSATSRCYFVVYTNVGLDHWGRYVDAYRVVGDRWLFSRRTVTVDGQSADSLFPKTD